MPSMDDNRVVKVELYVNNLYPGMILKGDAYDEKGDLVIHKGTPVSKEEINRLIIGGVKKISYSRETITPSSTEEPVMISKENYDEAMNVLTDIESSIINHATLQVADKLNKLIHGFIENIRDNRDTVLNLFDLTSMDQYNYNHSINVSTLAIILAIALKWEDQLIQEAGVAGLLMNIGMSMIPKEIVEKTEELTPQEWELMKRHPIFSYNILKNEHGISPNLLNGVLFHHEQYQGGGYPFGINYQKNNKVALMITLCDVYDAAITERPYRPALSRPDVFTYIYNQSGKKFNPEYVRMFLYQVSKKIGQESVFPQGAFVLLNTGEIGQVTGFQHDPYTLRPIINIFLNLTKKEKKLKYQISVDLNKNDYREIREIITELNYLEKLTQILTATEAESGDVMIF